MKLLLVSLLIATFAFALPPQTPVIGIFTLPDSGDEPKAGQEYPPPLQAGNYTYIAASYVKYIQMSGAQVVPIFAFSDTTTLDALLSKINGVLFTGGSQAIDINNKWTKNADYILKYAINQNKKGNVFPVWGTCLGWQLLSYLTSGYDSKWLSSVRGQSGVRNTISISSPSYLYDGISSTLKNKLENGNGVVYFNHLYAVSTTYFQTNQHLKAFWHVTSKTKSSYNQEFISTAEGIEYPVYGIQFHPEKNLYEWKVYADRSESGVEITQILSNKFVQKARHNKNRFPSQEDFRKHVIYNYKTQPTTMSFTQIYLFSEKHQGSQDRRQQVNLSIQ